MMPLAGQRQETQKQTRLVNPEPLSGSEDVFSPFWKDFCAASSPYEPAPGFFL